MSKEVTAKQWPSLAEAIHGWKFENDEVILHHIQHWILKATEAGLTSFMIEFDVKRGIYVCMAIR